MESISLTSTDNNATNTLNPIDNKSRILVMDLLRGFALIGILFMNIEWFNRPISDLFSFDFQLTGLDWAASWLVKVFIEGKFYRIFSLLFGMGFAVMLLKAQKAEKPLAAWFSRRMLALFIFGMLHLIFLWNGDILHDYALGGILLLGFVLGLRTKRFAIHNHPTTFLKFGLWIIAVPLFMSIAASLFFGITRPHQIMTQDWQKQVTIIEQSDIQVAALNAQAEKLALADDFSIITEGLDETISLEEAEEIDVGNLSPEERLAFNIEERVTYLLEMKQKHDEETIAFTQKSYAVATKFRAQQSLMLLKFTPILAIFICLPLFMIGYWLVASERITKPQSHKNFFNLLCWGGLLIGVMFNISGVYLVLHPAAKGATEIEVIGESLQFYGQLVLAFGYLGLFVKLSQKCSFLKWFTWLTPLGKMALTNYIGHSIILTSLFYGYAGGMFGQIARAEQMLIVLAIIGLQAIFSKLWLTYYKFGPLEWLWRSFTYLTWQPLRIKG
jgi:uncharacterized protein